MKKRVIPNHIAFIMDGNGRWAKSRLLPRNMGHREGVKSLKRVIKACDQLGVRYVSVFAFSTENWKRPESEVEALFDMVTEFANKFATEYKDYNYKIIFTGDIAELPEKVQIAIENSQKVTAENTGLVINIALNFGGRQEIIAAAKKLVLQGKTDFTEEDFRQALYCGALPDPDVVVRTSGEMRLSNFMLYESAYSELIFIDDLWPDMDKKSVVKIIDEYSKRDRRYGGI